MQDAYVFTDSRKKWSVVIDLCTFYEVPVPRKKKTKRKNISAPKTVPRIFFLCLVPRLFTLLLCFDRDVTYSRKEARTASSMADW